VARNAQPWRNRIIRTGEEIPDQLLANPRNWRIHPKYQQDALKSVLASVGWVTHVIVNERTGHVLDGHARVALAISRDEPTVPCTYVDLDEAEEAIVLATFDPIGSMAVTDRAMLDNVIQGVGTTDEDLAAVLADVADKLVGAFTTLPPAPSDAFNIENTLNADRGHTDQDSEEELHARYKMMAFYLPHDDAEEFMFKVQTLAGELGTEGLQATIVKLVEQEYRHLLGDPRDD
jgi:hypothetical protein